MTKLSTKLFCTIVSAYSLNCVASPCVKFGWRGVLDNLRLTSEWEQRFGKDEWHSAALQRWKSGLSFDFGKVTNEYYRSLAFQFRCRASSLHDELAQIGLVRSQMANLSALRAKRNFLQRVQAETGLELTKVENRVKAKSESIIFLEDFRQFTYELNESISKIDTEIIILEARATALDKKDAPTRNHREVLQDLMITKELAASAEKSANRSRWSFALGAGLESQDVTDATGIGYSRQPFYEATLSIPFSVTTLGDDLNGNGPAIEAASIEEKVRELHAAALDLEREREKLPEILRALDARISETQAALAALESSDLSIRQSSWLRLKQRSVALEAERIFSQEKANQLGSRDISVNNLSDSANAKTVSLTATSGILKPANTPDWMYTDAPTFRARSNVISQIPSEQRSLATELHFSITSPTTATTDKLASGAERHQWGIFVRAKDQCNLLYFMFRLDDSQMKDDEFAAFFVVQEKTNPSQSAHEDCGNSGYKTVAGSFPAASPIRIKKGTKHVLLVKDSGSELLAYLDNKMIWQLQASQLDLPAQPYVGVRSDNVVWEFLFKNNNGQ
jgi:hypothetical protein